MPKYTDGNAASQILIIGVAIYSTTMILGNIFSVLKLNKSLIMNSIYLCIFNVVFSCGLVMFVGKNIEMVAVGTGISYALYSLMLIMKLKSRFNYSAVKLLAKSWLPLLAVVAPGVIFYFVIPNFYVAMALSAFTVLLSYGIIWKTLKKGR
ncbi:MAG: polysaccharide biosynthesis C-terminal domain-containing protein [Bacteroidaceae bacterium]|nr:polysaccharide biosynthesis C-terminal domain-containing protein [Bacteroidaceae bacterium]